MKSQSNVYIKRTSDNGQYETPTSNEPSLSQTCNNISNYVDSFLNTHTHTFHI